MKPLKFLCEVPTPDEKGTQWVAVVIAENMSNHHMDTYILMSLEIQRHFRGANLTNIWCGEVPLGTSHAGYAMCQHYITGSARPAGGNGWVLKKGWPF